MDKPRARWPWVVLATLVVAGWAAGGRGHDSDGVGSRTATDATTLPSSSASAGPSEGATTGPPGPSAGAGDGVAQYAGQVKRYAARAGIDPQVLMAILYNEDYKPHDPALQRAWQKLKPDAAFGIANMHKAAFDQTKRGRDFADRDWEELPDDPGLAVEAAAWYLHDLAAQLPAHRATSLTEDQLLALGYNTGPGNMLAFARGVTLGPLAQSYLDHLTENWAAAGRDVRGAG
ncbi:transglycosylase SLT domain-containing protein [Actinacidiphila alni]|uniref:transglycosylase SLT domain-containing protein n=1 Tax=Actinacidiphila alni TaxID=380248 RepID=UPI000B89F21F|nr:transglycosylase SLT domain-containing protein [Actinacidiphila alni]